MFSDVDIKKAIELRKNNPDEGIAITPFEEKYLTGIGYDLRVGSEGFSWKKRQEIHIQQQGKIVIEPHDTVIIRTVESIAISKNIGATIHSVVSQAIPNGLSHISTTIDPGWDGKLLISLHNYRDNPVELKYETYFCTVCFYSLDSQAKKSPYSRPDRDDIWDRLLEKSREETARLNEEKNREISKKKAKTKTRFIFLIGFAVFALLIGIFSSLLYKPEVGSIISALIAAMVPLFMELLKKIDNEG